MQQSEVRTVVFFMVPDFTMMSFVAAIDPLRLANRMLGRKVYEWRLASVDGKPVRASNGVEVSVQTDLEHERKAVTNSGRAQSIIVCSGVNIEDYNHKSVFAWLREAANRGINVGGVCTAAFVLAKAGLLNGKRCSIHWENLPGFSEMFPNIEVYADLFETDGQIFTCAGGTSVLDLMLKKIGQEHGEELVNRVCEQLLMDRVRSPSDRQRLPLRARLGIQNARVLSIIELMEANIGEPLSLIDIANHVGLSRRQIERLFSNELGRSPARYYLEIRLDRARHLLIQSSLAVVEVAIACGFISASHFSKCYREVYRRSPQQERAERKQLLVSTVAVEEELHAPS